MQQLLLHCRSILTTHSLSFILQKISACTSVEEQESMVTSSQLTKLTQPTAPSLKGLCLVTSQSPAGVWAVTGGRAECLPQEEFWRRRSLSKIFLFPVGCFIAKLWLLPFYRQKLEHPMGAVLSLWLPTTHIQPTQEHLTAPFFHKEEAKGTWRLRLAHEPESEGTEATNPWLPSLIPILCFYCNVPVWFLSTVKL